MSQKGLTFGILSLCFCWVPILGLVFAILGLVKSIKAVKTPGESKGKSITGIALSGAGIFMGIYIPILIIAEGMLIFSASSALY